MSAWESAFGINRHSFWKDGALPKWFFVTVVIATGFYHSQATIRPLSQPLTRTEGATAYAPVYTYDPRRDAEQDVRDAVVEAHRTGRRVLLEVGGNWCIWCHILDRFFQEHPYLLEIREQNFVTVAVNYGPENKNHRVLGRYPPIPGYPHFFVLDEDGTLLRSQSTSELQQGSSYSRRRVEEFLLEWAPPSAEYPFSPRRNRNKRLRKVQWPYVAASHFVERTVRLDLS
jgi:hypothetical protein